MSIQADMQIKLQLQLLYQFLMFFKFHGLWIRSLLWEAALRHRNFAFHNCNYIQHGNGSIRLIYGDLWLYVGPLLIRKSINRLCYKLAEQLVREPSRMVIVLASWWGIVDSSRTPVYPPAWYAIIHSVLHPIIQAITDRVIRLLRYSLPYFIGDLWVNADCK